ncbi:MAG: tetratricopeptide repeat protein [Gammaproteobacteria bacterium]|jgi:type II protein arginine methyltransferase
MNQASAGAAADELLALAQQCRQQGDYRQAIAHCRTLLARREDHAQGLALLGQCLAASGDFPSAGHYLSRAIELDPGRAQPYIWLGEVNGKIGRGPEALRCFQRAAQLEPDDVDTLNTFAVALWGAGKIKEAESVLQHALAIEPENAFTLRNRQLLRSRLVDRWHFAMINDAVRNRHFEAALGRAITPDSVVLDIGAGSGLLSMMAARAGAKHVIACEAIPALAAAAREIIKTNGYSDRIRVVNKASRDLDPQTDFPRQARPDVLVAEVFDTQVIGEGALDTFEHARRCLLAPDAAVIPGRAVLHACLVESQRLWREGCAGQAAGFDLTPLNRFRPDTVVLEAASFGGRRLSEAFAVFNFDLAGDAPTPTSVRLDIPVATSGTCHGLVYWIQLHLDGETSIDNRPAFDGEPQGEAYCDHWYQVVKLLSAPIGLEAGMSVRIEVRRNRHNVAAVIYDPVTGKPLSD